MICAPIVAATHAEAERQLRLAAASAADLVELRLDHLEEPPDLPRLLAALLVTPICPHTFSLRPLAVIESLKVRPFA